MDDDAYDDIEDFLEYAEAEGNADLGKFFYIISLLMRSLLMRPLLRKCCFSNFVPLQICQRI